MAYYFPNTQGQIESQEQMYLLRKRIYTMLNGIIDNTNVDKELKSIDKEIEKQHKNTNYGRYEIESNKGMETTCLLLQQELHSNGKSMTVMEYETALEILRKRQEEWEKRKR